MLFDVARQTLQTPIEINTRNRALDELQMSSLRII